MATDDKPHWLQVDLQTVQDVSGTSVVWGSAGAPYSCKIEVSTDGLN
jgi:hypothetical protein